MIENSDFGQVPVVSPSAGGNVWVTCSVASTAEHDRTVVVSVPEGKVENSTQSPTPGAFWNVDSAVVDGLLPPVDRVIANAPISTMTTTTAAAMSNFARSLRRGGGGGGGPGHWPG
ncbi:hypothetical protein [Williamsia maris]|uniref:hypothetical protein n=1 Tax=Williamsia maris TaxID=72806 RepID=UPI0020A5187E|nr:hypothetical protein [Williamsia maris]